ncbi:hypothetical protein Tco_1242400 [Tanacetum coccineum]
MAIFVVSISSDSSKESVGTSTARVILFGKIPTAIPATVPIIDLPVVHDDTPLTPIETPTIPPVVSTLPYTSPFLYTDSSDSDILRDHHHRTRMRSFLLDDFSSDTSSGSSSGYSSYTSSDHSIPDSSFDSPAASFAGPSRKRHRSPVVSVPLATPVPKALSLVRANLLLPRKRIRCSVSTTTQDDSAEESYEAYIELNIDSDVQADIDVDIAAAKAATAREADDRVEVDTRIDREDEDDEEAESSHRGTIEIGVYTVVEPVVLKDTHVPTDDEDSREFAQLGLDEIVQELYDHLEEISVWSSRDIESVQIDQGHKMLVTSQHSAVMLDRIGVLERDNMRLRGMLCVERERVDSLRHHIENEDGHGDDNGNDNKNGNGDGSGNGNGNGLGGGNRNRNPNVNVGVVVPSARECTYQDFLKCQPLIFKGNEGVVGLTRWFEKMETVFHISNCPPKYQLKYASCTLQNGALTWWNSHKRTFGTDAAYAMTWKAFMKLMTKVFQELVLLYTKMVPEEEDRVEKFIGGLPDNIQGNVIAAEPTRL